MYIPLYTKSNKQLTIVVIIIKDFSILKAIILVVNTVMIL